MNKVEIVVTGQNRSKADLAAPKKEISELDKAAAKAEKSAAKMNDELANGLDKRGGMSAAEEAVKSLAKTADKAFDDLKDKFNKTADDIDRTANTKMRIKPEIDFDKDRMKSSMDGLGFDFSGMDVGGKGLFSSLLEGALKGGQMAKAGAAGAVDFVKGLGDGLKAQHPAVQGLVYATLAGAAALAAPFVGGALAGGIVAGFGAGIGGLGVMAATQNGKVRESFSNMWSGVVADTQARATVIEGVLLRTAGRAQTAWTQTGHVLTGAFSNVAPGLEKFLDGLLQSFQRFAPALQPMASAASAVFKDLGDRMPGIIGEIADSFTSLASSVEKNPEALGDFLASIGEIVEFGAGFLGFLNDVHEGNKIILDQFSMPFEWVGLKETGEAVGKVGDSMLRVSEIPPGPMESLQQAIAAIGEAGEDSAKKVDAVRQALDLLNGQTPDYTEGLAAAAEAVGKLDGAFNEAKEQAKGFGDDLLTSSGAFDVTNENGRALYQNVRDVTDAFSSMGAAVADGQMTREQFIADTGRMRDRLNETWHQAGLSKDQIAALNYQYGLTPDQIATMVRLFGAQDAEATLSQLARAREAVIYIRQQISTYGGYLGTGMNGEAIFHDRAHGGVASSFAHGGVVSKAAAGGVRRSNVVVNDWGSQSHGEAIRLPQGSTVIPASMTRSMESRWGTDRGAGQAYAAPRELKWIGPPDIIQWLKTMVRENGGDPSVFGGGA
jgi:ABC-type transporter Mla subunit MlaD